jgi:5-methylthioadenosine/S-adenosylhomocysteine deaminase
MTMDNGGPAAADLVIRGGDVVTMDEAGTVVRDGAVAVRDGKVLWVGPAVEAGRRYRAAETIDASGHIVMPGLVDAHMHAAQHFLRGKLSEISRQRAPKMPVWKHYYLPYEAMLTPEDVHISALAAYANMLMVGTTCFAEAGGPHPDMMAQAADEVGIRGFVALSTVDHQGGGTPPAMTMTTQDAIDRNVALVRRWSAHRRVHAFLALRQIIVCSADLTKAIAAAARDLDVKIHTHLAEGTYEVDFCLERFGKRPTEYLADLGVLSHHLHCAHSVLLSPAEVDLYVKHDLSACHCGFHNYALGAPRLTEMWRRGVRFGLGTDGAASSATLDVFQVAHVARIGQQVLAGTPWHMRTAISSEDLLTIATRGGARALGLNDAGWLGAGAKADIIVAATDDFDQLPVADPLFVAASTVVGRDVRTVVVDGRVVMKNRELLTIDTDELKAKIKTRRAAIMAAFDEAAA